MERKLEEKVPAVAEGPRKRKVFKNFAEYWHFVKVLTTEQRKVLAGSLTKQEQKSLQASYHKGGWEDLFMRNACDETLERIKEQLGIDLLDIRTKVVNSKPQLIQIGLWEYVNKCFDRTPWQHISYIFNGIIAEPFDQEYVKLRKITSKDFVEDEKEA